MDKIERAICKLLLPKLNQQGFELRKEWGFFVRKQLYGFDALMIVNQGTASGKYFEINVSSEIRHDCIEIPWNSLGFIYGEDSQQQTWTLMLPRLRNAPVLKVFPDSMKADVAMIAHEVETLFLQTSLPFYQRFADLREIEKLANATPLADLSPYSVGGPLDHQAMRSLLLAKAVNPEHYLSVRDAFVTSNTKTLFPREKCMELLRRVDAMEL